MNMINSLILEGVVSGEPHLVKTSDVLNFTVETTRYYKSKTGEDVEEKSQFKVVGFGRMADLPIEVGKQVRIVGRLNQNKWTDGYGVTHSEVQVVAEHIEIRKGK